MRIYIKKIGPDGLNVNDTIACEDIGLTKDDNIYFTSSVNVSAHVDLIDDVIIATVSTEGLIVSSCARCLSEVKRRLYINFELDYKIERGTEFVEIGEDVRQEIILGLPFRILCSEDCKGICPICGVNRNDCECGCNHKGI